MRREAGVLAAIAGGGARARDRSARGRRPGYRRPCRSRRSSPRRRRGPRVPLPPRARGRALDARPGRVRAGRRAGASCWRRSSSHGERVVLGRRRPLRVPALAARRGRPRPRGRLRGGLAARALERVGHAARAHGQRAPGRARDPVGAVLPRGRRAVGGARPARPHGRRALPAQRGRGRRALLGLGRPRGRVPRVVARRRARPRAARVGRASRSGRSCGGTCAGADDGARAGVRGGRGRARAVAASGRRAGSARSRSARPSASPRSCAGRARCSRSCSSGTRSRTSAPAASARSRATRRLWAAGFLAAFAPQLVVWKLLYGSFVTIPQGGGFVAGHPAWAGVLFSPHHGLFAWSPLLYVGLAGLALWARTAPGRALAVLAFLLALTRLNAGVADWPAGAAFGARRFDATLPFFGLGLAVAARATATLARRRPLLVPAARVRASRSPGTSCSRARTGRGTSRARSRSSRWGTASSPPGTAPLGSPFALPGSLFEWMTSGTPPRDWEALYMTARIRAVERAHGRGRPAVPGGRLVGAARARARTARARSRARRARLERPAAPRARATVRQPHAAPGPRPAGREPAARGLLDGGPGMGATTCSISPQDWFRPGRNALRIRAEAEGVEVAGVWLE